MNVELISMPENPIELSIGAAKTCFSKDIILPEDVKEKDYHIFDETIKAGHLTVIQHIPITFGLSGVSRHITHEILNSYPYYNTEQQSQRRVDLSEAPFYIPDIGMDGRILYESTVDSAINKYSHLKNMLEPLTEKAYRKRFPNRDEKTIKREAEKRAGEIARYVLPIAIHTNMYYTINLSTLFRFLKLRDVYSFIYGEEAGQLIDSMKKAVEEKHTEIFENYDIKPMNIEDSPEYQFIEQNGFFDEENAKKYVKEFDDSLEGHISKLISYVDNTKEMLENVYAKKIDIDALVNPNENKYLTDVINLLYNTPLGKVLYGLQIAFKTKISHTANSQNQRHRQVPGSTPLLSRHFTGEPDYITPDIIKQDKKILEFYKNTMNELWENINKLKSRLPEEQQKYAMYLLPNAVPVRLIERTDGIGYFIKTMQRTCLNAQKEIWKKTIDEVRQIQEKDPEIAKLFLPKCVLRKEAKIEPYCPEGKYYCGVPVFNLKPEKIFDYKRTI